MKCLRGGQSSWRWSQAEGSGLTVETIVNGATISGSAHRTPMNSNGASISRSNGSFPATHVQAKKISVVWLENEVGGRWSACER